MVVVGLTETVAVEPTDVPEDSTVHVKLPLPPDAVKLVDWPEQIAAEAGDATTGAAEPLVTFRVTESRQPVVLLTVTNCK